MSKYTPMSTRTLIKSMPNKHLISIVNTIRKEKQNPNAPHRFVTESEFWRGHHQDLKAELKIRQKKGTIKKSAGKSTKSSSQGSFFGMGRMRF